MWLNKEDNDAIGFVYKITDLTNNHFYIGKKLIKRLKNNTWNAATNNYQGSGPLKNANPDNLKKEIIGYYYSKSELAVAEIHTILFHIYIQKNPLCYNEMIHCRVRWRQHKNT